MAVSMLGLRLVKRIQTLDPLNRKRITLLCFKPLSLW